MKKKNTVPKIFLISSPSGGGEDSVIEGLKKHIHFNRVITMVTRPKLKGEAQGKPYYFISEKKFKKLIKKNELIEWAIVYGNYRGCTKKEIQQLLKSILPIVWKVDWQGVKTIKKIYPQAVAIFIAPPSYKALKKRLIKRGRDTIEDIKKRETFTHEWLKHKDVYDTIVVNDEGMLEDTINKVLYIMKKEKSP